MTRKYDKAYLSLGFTSTTVGNKERSQCIVGLHDLSHDTKKNIELKRDYRLNVILSAIMKLQRLRLFIYAQLVNKVWLQMLIHL